MDSEQALLCRYSKQFMTVLYQLGNPSVIQISELNESVSVFKHVYISGIKARIVNNTQPDAIGALLENDKLTLLFSRNFTNVFTPQLYYSVAIIVLFYERFHKMKNTICFTEQSVVNMREEVYTSNAIVNLSKFISLDVLSNNPGGVFNSFENYIETNLFGLMLQPILTLSTN
jgi:hypothetical protein